MPWRLSEAREAEVLAMAKAGSEAELREALPILEWACEHALGSGVLGTVAERLNAAAERGGAEAETAEASRKRVVQVARRLLLGRCQPHFRLEPLRRQEGVSRGCARE